MQELLAHWQLLAYLITTCIGIGVVYNIVRTNNERLDRLEKHGSYTSQQAARDVIAVERRVVMLEAISKQNTELLSRIDERTDLMMAHFQIK